MACLEAILLVAQLIHYLNLIYRADRVCVCVCVFAIRARVSCSVALKLAVVAGGIGDQVIAGLTSLVLRLTESYPSISAFSFADDGHFLIIVTIDSRFLPVDSLSSYVRI